MASARAGITYQPRGQTTLEYLPLEEVKVRAWVVDDEPTGRAKYVFPLPDKAAVCAFELEIDDGSIIVGEIKEKEDAARTFTQAAEQGKVAALVESVTNDIFTISVGSIPAAARVVAHLTFVMDILHEALTDHIRLQLPMHIAERYGTPPSAILDASAANSRTRVDISVDIQTSDIIYAIDSPTHPIIRRRYKGRSGQVTQRRMSAVWRSPEFLSSDFVITIHAEGLDKPRCFAEVLHMRETQETQEHTVAMQLTLVPKFQSPKVPSQEYIFVIDRSGSMQCDNKIETAKQTLTMLLRLLPSSETTFNIFSFGTQVKDLWKCSRALKPASLDEATSHVASMDANLGGTDIPQALQSAFRSRALDRPAVVFLLTDGLINVEENVLPNVIQNSSDKVSVRLFVLGIGRDVSQDVCSKLARHGNGEALFAVSTEEILGKCASLMNAARSKNIESINVDWGCDVSQGYAATAAIHLPASLPALEPPPPVQQVPDSLTKIFTGVRFTVFAIASFRSVPTSVRLLTKLDGDPEPKELIVHVTTVKPFHKHLAIPIVHTLAARRLIMDLDDGAGPLPTPVAGDGLSVSEDDLRKAGIIRLGLTYHLVSKHTSFVAVQKEGEHGYRRGRTGSEFAQTGRDVQEDRSTEEPTFLDNLIDGISSFFTSVFNRASLASIASTPHFRSRHRAGIPGAYSESDSDTSQSRGRGLTRRRSNTQRGRSRSSNHSTYTFSSLSSLEGSSCSSCWTSSRSPSPFTRFNDPIERPPSPEFTNARTSGLPDIVGPGPSTGQGGPRQRPPIPRDVFDLFQQMNVDGSFTVTPLFVRLVGNAVLGKADELGIDKDVWTTVVFVAYIKTSLRSEPDLLDLMSEKAKEFVEASERSRRGGARRFTEMVREAEAALRP